STQIEVGARGNTTLTSPTAISSPYYLFDPDKFSGTTTAYFQATLRSDANVTTDDYVFNSYDSGGEEWSSNPGFMANSVTTSYASSDVDGDVQLLTSNNSNSTDLGIITKVEVRAHAYQTDGSDGQVLLRPVFSG